MIDIKCYGVGKKVNSTARPSGDGVTFRCDIKSPCSILNPIIILDDARAKDFNYIYIPSFNRYYWIDNITFSEGLWIMSCSVDVLATYRNIIGNENLYITRSSIRSDGSLIDNAYATKTEPTITIDTQARPIKWQGFDSGYYILGVQGQGSTSVNGVTYYQLPPNLFDLVIRTFYASSGSGSWWGNTVKGVINSLNKLDDFIVSCRWYPHQFVTSGSGKVWLGSYETTVTGDIVVDYPNTVMTMTFTIPKHPQASSRGNYLNYLPYSKYILQDDLIGQLPLNPDWLQKANYLRVIMRPDFTSGEMLYQLMPLTSLSGSGPIIYSTFINYGVDINLSGAEISIGATAGNIVQALGDVSVGNYIGAMSGVGSAIANSIPSVGFNQSRGGYAAIIDSNARLFGYFYNLIDEDRANKGRPYCKFAKPSDVGGYMEVENPHIYTFQTQEETDRVNQLLQAGIYYE